MLPWYDLRPFPEGTTLPALVWTGRGDEVWRWDGESWVRAEPQPPRRFQLLVGTVCEQRDHHNLTPITDVHAVSDDC